jgi:transposase, IS30 family
MIYKHLSICEREKIQELYWLKKSVRNMAEILGRSPSSISRELRRNFPKEFKRYTPRLANERALLKRKERGRKDRLKTKEIRTYVITKLKLRWSPEQISGRMRIDLKQNISHEAIYQFIYNQVHRDGWGELKLNHEDLRIYLRRKQKRRQKKGLRKSQRIFKPKGISIDERPKIVDTRKRIGDWEGDSVESVDHKPGVNTLLERRSGMYLITKLKSKTASATREAVRTRFEYLPDKCKRTLTLDNGAENSDWELLQKEIKIKCFYAHPYHSWERGSNENANGLLRDYFPKKTDFSMISNELLAIVEHELNTRPRKRLGFKTPLEVWSVALRG